MPICRVQLEERNNDYPEKRISSIFAGSDVVDEPDECRIEARRQNMSAWIRRQNEINSEKGRLKAEREIAKKIEDSQ